MFQLFTCRRKTNISEETIASIVANSTERFINENKFCQGKFKWPRVLGVMLFRYQKAILQKSVITFLTEVIQFLKPYLPTLSPHP